MVGCRGAEAPRADAVATIRPLAAILEPIVGGDVPAMLPSGASPHTYDPKPSDVRTASSASTLFYGSRDLDAWAAGLDVRSKISLLGLVPDSLLLRVQGHGEHADPHFWMDPLTVRSIVPAIADTLCALRADRCAGYRERAAEFAGELTATHDSLRSLMQDVQGASVLLSHPFLGYFARRYGLVVAGVIEEIPGGEPTPRDMLNLVKEAERTEAGVIITLPQHSSRAAEAVSEATDIPVVELDPIGGGANGYRDLLYFNARTIYAALTESPPEP